MKPYLYPLYFLAIVALSSNVWDLRDACNAGNIDRLNTILSNDANLPFLTSRDFGITSLSQRQSAKRNLTLDASQCSITLFIIADNSMINTSRQRDCYERLIEHYCSNENPNRNLSETIWNCDICSHMRSMNLLRAAIDTFKWDQKKLLRVTQLLINSGADPNALDGDGLPAIEVFFRDHDYNHDVMRILGENTNMTMPPTLSKDIAHWYHGQVDNLFKLMTQRGIWEKNEGSAVKCLSLFSDNMTFDKFLSLIEPFDWSDESRQRCVKKVIDQTLEFPEKLRPLCWQSISPANPILRDAVECHKNSWDRRYQIKNLVLRL